MRLALLVIDMQNHFKEMAETINKNVIALVERCHEKEIPVVFTQHNDPEPRSRQSIFLQSQIVRGSENWQLCEPIALHVNKEKDYQILDKCRYDAFYKTDLKNVLVKNGVDTVIITGVMTNLCCETTARVALCDDFDVIFVSDGNATRKQEWHDATLENISGYFGKVLTTADVLKLI